MPTARPRLLSLIALLAVAACSSKDAPDDAASSPDAPATSEAPAASGAPAGEPTAVDYGNYELTMDKMRNWVNATKNIATIRFSSADSAAMTTMSKDPAGVRISKMESIEPVKRALSDAGLNARDYMMITGAYAMSGMPTSKNLEFVKAHKVELDRLMEEMKTIGR